MAGFRSAGGEDAVDVMQQILGGELLQTRKQGCSEELQKARTSAEEHGICEGRQMKRYLKESESIATRRDKTKREEEQEREVLT